CERRRHFLKFECHIRPPRDEMMVAVPFERRHTPGRNYPSGEPKGWKFPRLIHFPGADCCNFANVSSGYRMCPMMPCHLQLGSRPRGHARHRARQRRIDARLACRDSHCRLAMIPAFDVRFATPADVPDLISLVRALAAYERLAHLVVADEAQLAAALFG